MVINNSLIQIILIFDASQNFYQSHHHFRAFHGYVIFTDFPKKIQNGPTFAYNVRNIKWNDKKFKMVTNPTKIDKYGYCHK